MASKKQSASTSLRPAIAAMVEKCLMEMNFEFNRHSKGGKIYFNVTPNHLHKSARAVLGFEIIVGDDVIVRTELGNYFDETRYADLASPTFKDDLMKMLGKYDFIQPLCASDNQRITTRKLRGAYLVMVDDQPIGFMSASGGKLKLRDMSGSRMRTA